jgi:hypothetical protein
MHIGTSENVLVKTHPHGVDDRINSEKGNYNGNGKNRKIGINPLGQISPISLRSG